MVRGSISQTQKKNLNHNFHHISDSFFTTILFAVILLKISANLGLISLQDVGNLLYSVQNFLLLRHRILECGLRDLLQQHRLDRMGSPNDVKKIE